MAKSLLQRILVQCPALNSTLMGTYTHTVHINSIRNISIYINKKQVNKSFFNFLGLMIKKKLFESTMKWCLTQEKQLKRELMFFIKKLWQPEENAKNWKATCINPDCYTSRLALEEWGVEDPFKWRKFWHKTTF